MKTYSYSRLSMYRQCQRRYFFRWVQKTKPIVIPQSAELFLGNRLHEAMAFLYRNHATGLMPPLDEVLADFNARWETGWSDTIDLGIKGHTAESVKAVGERAVRDYFARRHPFMDDRTVGLEQPVSFVLDAETRFRIMGRLDRLSKVADGYVITDYKSGARLPTVKDIERDDQLWLYSLVIGHGLPTGERVHLRWEFLRFDARPRSRRRSSSSNPSAGAPSRSSKRSRRNLPKPKRSRFALLPFVVVAPISTLARHGDIFTRFASSPSAIRRSKMPLG